MECLFVLLDVEYRMSHRVNMLTGRKEPKPHARERTWFRWRIRKDIPNQDDNLRLSNSQEVKNRFLEMLGLGKNNELQIAKV